MRNRICAAGFMNSDLLRKLLFAGIGLLPLACASGAPSPEPTPESGLWELIPGGESPMHRHENGYVRVGDLFYLVGGRGDRPVEIFDPTTETWTTGAMPPIEMHHFQAIEHDGSIYVAGAMTGSYPTEPPIPSIQIYYPESDEWHEGPEIPEDRRRGGAGAVVHDGLIYIIAGIQNGHTDGHVAWLDAFDPQAGTWHRLADAPRARDHFHAAVIDGRIHVAGGRRSSAATGQVFELTVPEVDVYDIASAQWSTLPESANIPTMRAGTSAAVLSGRLFVLGGESGAQLAAHSEVEVLDPSRGEWTAVAPMEEGRHGTQVVEYEGRLYIAAGSRTRGATEINSQEVFSPGAF